MTLPASFSFIASIRPAQIRFRPRLPPALPLPSSASSSPPVMASPAAAQRLYAPHIQHNTATLANAKFITSCFAGAVAGVLGLENWAGFALFVLATALAAAVLYTVNFRGRPRKFVQGGMLEVVNPGQENIASFILAWTLFYGASWPVAAW